LKISAAAFRFPTGLLIFNVEIAMASYGWLGYRGE
jgi:hypothetical protein